MSDLLTFKRISAAGTNAEAVLPGAHTLGGYYISNANASAFRFLKLYDKATPPNVGIDVPKITIGIPFMSAANIGLDDGIAFELGIALAMTTGVADTDATGVAANELVVNLFYEIGTLVQVPAGVQPVFGDTPAQGIAVAFDSETFTQPVWTRLDV